MPARWLSMLSMLVIVAGCRDRQENESTSDPARDTVAMVSPSSDTAAAGTAADTRRGSGPSGAPAGSPAGARAGTDRPVLVVQVQEEVPGLLEQARYHPLDAQHIAQGKYPKGRVQAGWLERRGGDLVYRFRIRDEDGAVNDVLVDSFQGRIINSIPVR